MRTNIKLKIGGYITCICLYILPSVAFTQSLCEGLEEIVSAIDDDRYDELEFFSVPGATCKSDYQEFSCMWQKQGIPAQQRDIDTTRPHHLYPRSSPSPMYKKWSNAIFIEVKKLASEINKCIKQSYIERETDIEWGAFEMYDVYGNRQYSVYGKGYAGEGILISVCYVDGDDYGNGAGVVLAVTRPNEDTEIEEGDTDCGIAFYEG